MNNIINKEYIRINKTKAHNLYIHGRDIYLLPCKASLNSYWFTPIKINVSKNGSFFHTIINAFEYYNCNNQLGYYTAFYIKRGDNN